MGYSVAALHFSFVATRCNYTTRCNYCRSILLRTSCSLMDEDDSKLTRDIAPFGVRMPADLKSRVAASAAANNRSMNAEIVATLQEKYPEPTLDDLRVYLEEIRARLEQVRSEDDAKALAEDVGQRIKEKGR